MTAATPSMSPRDRAVPAWLTAPGTLALLAMLLVAGVWSRWAAWADVAHIVERDPESSHVLLVPVVFVWLMATYRRRFAGFKLRLPWLGFLIAASGFAISVYGDVTGRALLWHAGAVIVLVGAATAVMGVQLLTRFWPAFVLLAFCLPPPGSLRQPVALWLQNVSAQWVQHALTLFGVPIHRAGNVLVVNGTEVGIAEACNGMRMMMMLFLVCYTFVFVNPLRPWVRVTLLVLAPVLALVTNIVRLVPTVLVYGHASEETATQFHDWLGWAMIVVSYLLLMGVIALLRWLLVPVMADEPRTSEKGAAVAAA